MGLFSRFEDKAESVIEGGSGRGKGGIEPVKLCKRALKEMQREKMVGVGHEYAPTLYNVLVSPEDDARMSGYYPSLAGEIETFLAGKAKSANLVFDCPPLVRFIVDDGLKRGRFDIIAESVSPAIIADLREEEMEHYGIRKPEPQYSNATYQAPFSASPAAGQATGYGALDDEPQAGSLRYQPDYEPSMSDPVVPEAFSPEGPAAVPTGRTYPPTEVPDDQDDSIPEATHATLDPNRTALVDAPITHEQPSVMLYDYASRIHHTVMGPRAVVGRGSTCDVVISDPSVSRRHAEVLHDPSGWLIRDTGSTNGVKVNGVRCAQTQIYPGDVITLGTAELEVREA